jgi:hypothetical protein
MVGTTTAATRRSVTATTTATTTTAAAAVAVGRHLRLLHLHRLAAVVLWRRVVAISLLLLRLRLTPMLIGVQGRLVLVAPPVCWVGLLPFPLLLPLALLSLLIRPLLLLP